MTKITGPLLLLSLLIFSCSRKDDRVEVQFWSFGGTPHQIAWIEARVDSFNASHPGIRVVRSQKSWNMIRELLYTNLSTGSGPDLMNVHANYAAEFGEAGFFLPIDRFSDFEQVRDWYEPNLFETVRYKENYYGLPGPALAFMIACNKEMFDAEGIAPPRTWSEFREAARRLTKDTDGDGADDQWGLVLYGGDKGGFSYRFAPFLYKAGVSILSDDLTKAEFNTPMGVAALQLFADMHQIDHSITPGFLAYQHSEINDLFCSNKVAMNITGPWYRGMIQMKCPGKDIYVVPIPVPDHLLHRYDTLPTLQDMVMYSINTHSKHPDEAWEVAKYFRNEEADMASLIEDMGGLPTTKKALHSPEAEKVKDMPMFRNELKYARPWPSHPGIINIARNVITPWCQRAIVGEITPQEALEGASREAQMILDEER
jgi:multiple sugar transport system substrate-binding protein